jgi:Cu+-exporting ATPase
MAQSDSAALDTELVVSGMTCNNCARHVTEALRSVPGVQRAVVDLEHGAATVRWSREANHDPGPLLHALDEAGYSAQLKTGSTSSRSLLTGWRFNVILGLGVTIPLMILEWGFGAGMQRWYHWLSFALVLPVQVLCGWRFYSGAWAQLKVGRSNMDTLVSLGSTTAFLFSVWGLFAGWEQHLYFMDAAAIITLVSVGHFLEEKVSARAASALRALLNLAPETARKLVDGREEIVPVSDLKPGDIVALRAGDRIPTDGAVNSGHSVVNESMLTGESLPVEKSTHSKVFAGTLNESGTLSFRVTTTGESTALARIIAIVEQAQSSRAQIQRLGDRVSNVFVPVVVLVALAAALWWGLAPASAEHIRTFLAAYLWHSHSPDSPFAAAIFHAAAVLIIACPCAMGLATPIAIMAGTNAAARRGILIRDGAALEKSGTITAIVFDKTGTLTQGKFSVAQFEEFDPNAKAIAASLALHSTHPMSKAIAAFGGDPSIQFSETREIPGSGLEARRNSDTFRLGSLRWLQQQSQPADGSAQVGLTRNDKLIALFTLKDEPKRHAQEVIRSLQPRAIYLVSGDNRQTSEALAAQVGIPAENVRAEVRPEGKLEFIRDLQQKGERVAFIGDGINDAPALNQADLGIALMNASDVARESADIILLNADLEAIPEALHLAQRTLKVIKQNLFWAFFYNALGVPLAALGFLSPIFSAFAMGMSDLIVVANALRLKIDARLPHRP